MEHRSLSLSTFSHIIVPRFLSSFLSQYRSSLQSYQDQHWEVTRKSPNAGVQGIRSLLYWASDHKHLALFYRALLDWNAFNFLIWYLPFVPRLQFYDVHLRLLKYVPSPYGCLNGSWLSHAMHFTMCSSKFYIFFFPFLRERSFTSEG